MLTTVHLLAAAAWAGGLVHTLQALRAWRHVRAARWWVLRGYVRVAAGSVLLLAGTGVVSGLWLVSLSQLAGTGYGRILLIKLAMVLVATVVAAVARRLRQRRAASRLIAAAGVEPAYCSWCSWSPQYFCVHTAGLHQHPDRGRATADRTGPTAGHTGRSDRRQRDR